MSQCNKKTLAKTGLSNGFSLIEMLVVIAIIGIIMGIALPSYNNSVKKNNRAVAKAELLDLANKQEQYYLDNKTYTTALSNLGYSATLAYDVGGVTDKAIAVSDTRTAVASTATDRVYSIQIDSATASSFQLTAVPQLEQANDADCANLTLTSAGQRTASGTLGSSLCW